MIGDSRDEALRRENQAMIKYGGGSKKSEYRTMALAELELGQTTEEVMIEAERGTGEKNKGDESLEGGLVAQGALLSEIDRVMLRVEEALNELEDSEGNKRVRRSLETSATEVRTLVKSIENEESGEAVEGARIKGGKVILFIASESSEKSGEKKRKHKSSGKSKAGSVASRLRRKSGVGTKEGEPSKAPRMVVRKVKAAAAKKPSTSLTLAPPTMGLPNE